MRAGELRAIGVPDTVHEALRDLPRVREVAMIDPKEKRQRLDGPLGGLGPRACQAGRSSRVTRKRCSSASDLVQHHGSNETEIAKQGLSTHTGLNEHPGTLQKRPMARLAEQVEDLLVLRGHARP